MDIKHLEYFIAIAENRFNISKTATLLSISQPALTKYIRDFEIQEKTELFIRYKGRLVDLTPIGKEFFDRAKLVVHDFHSLIEDLHKTTTKLRGTVRIGIPTTVISLLFHEAIPNFLRQNPDIELKVIESGAFELQKMLLAQEVDLALLMEPITLPNISYQRIFSEQMVAVLGIHHPLASATKHAITYKDIANEQLVIFNEKFMLHDQIIKNFHLAGITPQVFFKSGDWELLANLCKSMNVVTFLPLSLLKHYPSKDLTYRTLNPEFPWHISLAKLTNVYHNDVINYTEEYFKNIL